MLTTGATTTSTNAIINTDFISWLEGYLEDKLTREQIDKIKEKYNVKQDFPYIPPFNPYNPHPFNTSPYCIDGCEYETPWFGIYPPSCKKCGKQGLGLNITY